MAVIVQKRNMLTGKMGEMLLDVTIEDLKRYEWGEDLVQNIFPHLTAEEREFLISGLLPQEQEETFTEPEE